MKYSYTLIRLLNRPHRFFVYYVGQPDDHIMDWAGCNFHMVKAEGQPKGGFEEVGDAILWEMEKQMDEGAIQNEIWPKSGTFLKEEIFDQVCGMTYPPNSNTPEFEINCEIHCDKHNDVYMKPSEEWLKKYNQVKERLQKKRMSLHRSD